MSDAFQRRLALTAHWEGGFVNHKDDPGGATRWGITRGTLSKWRRRRVTVAEVRALSREEAERIYRTWYWDSVRGDDLPEALAGVVFDEAVNAGPGRAAIRLQKAIRKLGIAVAVDGAIGPETAAACDAIVAAGNLRALVVRYVTNRLLWYRALPSFDVFGLGWSRRAVDSAVEAGTLMEGRYVSAA